MGQGQIRKGFFFYFGLFVLLLIAVFMVCLVIMMFNPGKTVLWMQYFTADETIHVVETTDDSKTAIDLSAISNVEISCSYANVSVYRSKEIETNGIHIINKAKGFAGAKDAVAFNYEAVLVGSTLQISVTEPNGFLYLSKDIQVVLSAYIYTNANFENINLKVTTTKGKVTVGENKLASEDVKLASLTAETTSGDIIIGSKFDSTILTKLDLKTQKGKITSQDVINYNSQDVEGLRVGCNVSLSSREGRINLGTVVMNGKVLTITSVKADVVIDCVVASLVDVRCKEGNYLFGKIYGHLSYTNSEDSLLAPNIMADYIAGDFRISASVDVEAKPDIEIGKVDGKLDVNVDRGSVSVDEANGEIAVIAGGNMDVDVVVGEGRNAAENIFIENKDGAIKLGFLNQVLGNIRVETTSGSTTINFVSTAKFVSTAYKNDGTETNLVDEAKISANIGTTGNITKNPLKPNEQSSGESGTMTIVTNKNISYNVKEKDEIKRYDVAA